MPGAGRQNPLCVSYPCDAAGDHLGWSVALVGDVDRDGYADLILGAAFDSRPGTDAGVMEVYSFGGSGQPPVIWHRGKPCLGSNGLHPRLSLDGRPALDEPFRVDLRGAPANAPVLLNFGDPRDIALDGFGAPGCTAYADPAGFNVAAAADLEGAADFGFVVPNEPALIGLRFDFQWIAIDAAANSLGFTFSDAAAVRFGM